MVLILDSNNTEEELGLVPVPSNQPVAFFFFARFLVVSFLPNNKKTPPAPFSQLPSSHHDTDHGVAYLIATSIAQPGWMAGFQHGTSISGKEASL
jgi:hypothetical protein